jgi:hypothetical protein
MTDELDHGKGSTPDMKVADVFLGGACGKTTWRKEIAIPYLTEHGVTYWNPQAGFPPDYSELMSDVSHNCRSVPNNRLTIGTLD